MDPMAKGLELIEQGFDLFRKDACDLIDKYSVGLVLEGELIGSGTLIKWKNSFGILTAEHVINNPHSIRLCCNFSNLSEQKLQVICTEFPAFLDFEMKVIQKTVLGTRLSDELGPDVAVLTLPPVPQLGALIDRKSFWPVDNNPAFRIQRSLSGDGFHMLVGIPGEGVTETGADLGFTRTKLAPGIAGETRISKYFEDNGFDYLEAEVERNAQTKTPKSLGGMSGGGLWKVTISRKAEECSASFKVEDVTLAGVIFFDTDKSAEKRPVRCHGPKTIYNLLAGKLRN